jgi:anaerobic magnesium-protoporphyrin IX monomethyl ester cyclase
MMCMELLLQTRPRALWRLVAERDPKICHAIRWYYRIGRWVWLHELRNFCFRDRRVRGPILAEFWGSPQDADEQSMAVGARITQLGTRALASGPQTVLRASG